MTWLTGAIEGEGESRVSSKCQLGFIKQQHLNPFIELFPWHSRQLSRAPAPGSTTLELDLNDEFSSLCQSRQNPEGLKKLDQVWGAGLTGPRVIQAYQEAPSQVEGGVESIAEEGRHVEGGEQGGDTRRHSPAAEDRQPHEQEVQQEGLGARAQVGQPVGGHPIDDDVGTVLRKRP